MFGSYSLEACKHEAHQVQAGKLPVGQRAEFVFLVWRGVVESVPAQQCDFKRDRAYLLRRHRIEPLEGVEKVENRRRLLGREQSRIGSAFLERFCRRLVMTGVGPPFIPIAKPGHVSKLVHQPIFVARPKILGAFLPEFPELLRQTECFFPAIRRGEFRSTAKQIIQEDRVSSIQREAREQDFSGRELADFRLAAGMPRFVRHDPEGKELRGLEQLERVAQVPLNQHVERAVEQEFAESVDQRQRQPGDLLFGVSGLFPLADVARERPDGRVPCLGGGGEEKVFANLARLGFELKMGQFVAL